MLTLEYNTSSFNTIIVGSALTCPILYTAELFCTVRSDLLATILVTASKTVSWLLWNDNETAAHIGVRYVLCRRGRESLNLIRWHNNGNFLFMLVSGVFQLLSYSLISVRVETSVQTKWRGFHTDARVGLMMKKSRSYIMRWENCRTASLAGLSRKSY